jgi:hypothetical protein
MSFIFLSLFLVTQVLADFDSDGYALIEDSADCNSDCLKKGYNFCPVTNKTMGYCCKEDYDCPMETVCTYQALDAYARLRGFACPN